MAKRRKLKKRFWLYLIFIPIIIIVIVGLFYYRKNALAKEEIKIKEEHIKLVQDSFNKYVKTNKETSIYVIDNDNFKKIGILSGEFQLELSDITDDYYKISNLDSEYYVKYSDVDKINNIEEHSTRYKKYIPFNQNIKTNEKTNLYDLDNNLVISLDKEITSPIIIKEKERFGIIYQDTLYYVKNSEVTVSDNKNSNDTNTKGIAVLNYHFVYEDSDNSCHEDICVSESFFRKHMDYIRDNNYFTPTMRELEMYIDGNIQLPKSVVITFDDGRYLNNAKRIMEEYKLNGTFFVISGWRWNIDFKEYKSDYLELHSHTHNMHDVGQCPTGQGGGIQCLSEEKIQNDLKLSRETLYGTTYLAYPFYEYNNYSIEQLKKAGFTMAFGGEYENGYKYVKPGIDKYRLPRWVIVNWTSNYDFTSYLTLK